MPSLSKTLALALAATLAAASPDPAPASGEFKYGAVCEASDGSPTTGDVTKAINELKGRTTVCTVNNGMGSDCTTWADPGTASISICGKFKAALKCTDMANYANEVQQLCVSQGHKDKVGGTFYVNDDPEMRIVIAHS